MASEPFMKPYYTDQLPFIYSVVQFFMEKLIQVEINHSIFYFHPSALSVISIGLPKGFAKYCATSTCAVVIASLNFFEWLHTFFIPLLNFI